jgi:hypothetical protein
MLLISLCSVHYSHSVPIKDITLGVEIQPEERKLSLSKAYAFLSSPIISTHSRSVWSSL